MSDSVSNLWAWIYFELLLKIPSPHTLVKACEGQNLMSGWLIPFSDSHYWLQLQSWASPIPHDLKCVKRKTSTVKHPTPPASGLPLLLERGGGISIYWAWDMPFPAAMWSGSTILLFLSFLSPRDSEQHIDSRSSLLSSHSPCTVNQAFYAGLRVAPCPGIFNIPHCLLL